MDDLKRMISQYDLQFKTNQTLNDRPIDDPWFEHTQEIKKKLANKHGLLHRRLWEVAIPMDLIPRLLVMLCSQ